MSLNQAVSSSPVERPRRLLLLGSQIATGGAQAVLLNQAFWFHQHGYNVTVAFFYDKQCLLPEWQARHPFPVIDLHAWQKERGAAGNAFHLLGGILRLYRLLRKNHFDGIETFTHHSNFLGLPVAWLAGVPVRLATHHGRILNFPPVLERIHAWMVNAGIATRLVAVSEETRRAAIAEGVRPERIEVIHNGIVLRSPDLQAGAQARAALGAGPQTRIILSVGRLVPEKGHARLIEAACQVIEAQPDTLFVLAGDGTLRAQLENQALCLGIPQKVRFLGMRKDVLDLLSGADIFVQPSISEGQPLAVMEAMSAGLAVIATDVGGLRSLIEDGVTGLPVPSGDSQALSRALLRLLADPGESARLGQAARRRILDSFSLDSMCQRYEQQFRTEWQKEKK